MTFEIVIFNSDEILGKCKGKHKNSLQEDTLIQFMENHPDLARGFTKGDRIDVENLWKDLTKDLNSLGPPTRDTNGWKKVWRDWKTCIKKKIATNKQESISTGGGPYNQIYISKKEELIGQICGLYTLVEGITNAKSIIGEEESSNDEVLLSDTPLMPKSHLGKRKQNLNYSDNIPSTSKKSAKGFKTSDEDIKEHLKKYMNENTKKGEFLSDSIKTVIDIFNKNEEKLDIIGSNVRGVYEAIGNLTTNVITELQRHNQEMEKAAYVKNELKKKDLEIKKKQLEIDLIKYQQK